MKNEVYNAVIRDHLSSMNELLIVLEDAYDAVYTDRSAAVSSAELHDQDTVMGTLRLVQDIVRTFKKKHVEDIADKYFIVDWISF